MRTIRLITFFGMFIICNKLQAQETANASALVVYEVLGSQTEKSDHRVIGFDQLPGVQKHFFCTQNNVLYLEIEMEQVAQIEAFMNHHNISCMPKLNCTLQRIQDQCITEIKD
jgi:hypothetical protein